MRDVWCRISFLPPKKKTPLQFVRQKPKKKKNNSAKRAGVRNPIAKVPVQNQMKSLPVTAALETISKKAKSSTSKNSSIAQLHRKCDRNNFLDDREHTDRFVKLQHTNTNRWISSFYGIFRYYVNTISVSLCQVHPRNNGAPYRKEIPSRPRQNPFNVRCPRLSTQCSNFVRVRSWRRSMVRQKKKCDPRERALDVRGRRAHFGQPLPASDGTFFFNIIAWYNNSFIVANGRKLNDAPEKAAKTFSDHYSKDRTKIIQKDTCTRVENREVFSRIDCLTQNGNPFSLKVFAESILYTLNFAYVSLNRLCP